MTFTFAQLGVITLLASCITMVVMRHWSHHKRWVFYPNQKNRRLLPPAHIYVPYPYPTDTLNSDRDDRLVQRRAY
jgi:hypothetical protein